MEGVTSLRAELAQMISMKVWHGVHLRSLTPSQRQGILRCVVFLKDKYTAQNIFEKFKARLCANGSKQDHALYDDVSSPTSTTTSVLITAAIAAAEERKVITVDVGGAFLHADMEPTGVEVLVELDPLITKFLVELDPGYEQFVTARKTCVVKLDKALYGTIEAAKLWYDLISAELRGQGFVPNPYDPCVFNKELASRKQITATIHVDDMMVSCEDNAAIDDFVYFLERRFGIDKVTRHRGQVLDFLGMTFDFLTIGEVRVTMKRLIDEIIAGAGVTREYKTPAADELFDTRDAPKLDVAERDRFRSYVAKLLFVAKRVKPEMLTTVSFLTTRAREPDIDDKAKLDRALGYLIATRDSGIVLRIGDRMEVSAYIDAAYGVHSKNRRSHTGACIVIGLGGPSHVKSGVQKSNTKSSTECELMALSDYASQAVWARNFVIAQGYDVGPVTLYQDNTSCMALMKRGGPASERSRHIDIRHFWVKELVDEKIAVIKHLGTDKMFANVLTKPLQGKQFVSERSMLTGWY